MTIVVKQSKNTNFHPDTGLPFFVGQTIYVPNGTSSTTPPDPGPGTQENNIISIDYVKGDEQWNIVLETALTTALTTGPDTVEIVYDEQLPAGNPDLTFSINRCELVLKKVNMKSYPKSLMYKTFTPLNMNEMLYFHKPSKTLIATDAFYPGYRPVSTRRRRHSRRVC